MSIFTTTLKYLFYAYLASSYKSLPLAYYVRFYYIIVKNLILPKSLRQEHKIKSPFQIDSYKTYNSPFECDFYMHKSNSTYFEELDIVRTQLMTSIFQKFFIEFPTESKTWPFIPVANIFCNFKKEIKPFEKYRVDSRILAWDSKWLFIISKFVTEKKGEDVICSTAITKYVLKDGRKTIKPEEALKFVGLWNEEFELKSQKNLKLVEYFIDTNDLDSFELLE